MRSLTRRLGLAVAVLGLVAGAEGQARAELTLTYVGSWDLATLDGGFGNPSNPYIWYNNPQSYSGVEAAAKLFGGSASDYAISTVGTDPTQVNHLAFLDGYGNTQYLFSPTSESYELQTGSSYSQPPSFSALVVDHAPSAQGSFVNYAFRITITDTDVAVVPEPSTIVLTFTAVPMGLFVAWSRRKAKLAA